MRLYRLLLRVFPPAFRARFGDDLAELFADRRTRAHGPIGRIRFWSRTLRDVTTHGLAERRAERTRDSAARWSHTMMQALLQDLRFAGRSFRRRPGFTAVALVTLTLGIGANTAIFSVVHAVLIRDLPYADGDRLVSVYEMFRRNFMRGVANPFNYTTWERQARSFEALAAFRMMSGTLTGAGEPARVRVARVSGQFFDILGVPAARGRTLTADDADRDAATAVVSHAFWTTTLGGDPNVIGRTLTLDGSGATVVGVMPPSFRYPQRIDIWRPLHLSPAFRANMNSWFLGVVGKLAPGATVEQAQRELDAISAQLEREHPKQRKDRGAWVVALQDDLAYRSASNLELLQGIVVLVLIIACANVANLLLASASGRRRELSIRASIGASRARLVRQLVTESVLLSVAGGLLGAALAAWGVQLLVSAAPEFTLPENADVRVSAPVLAFTFGVAMITGVLAGVGPALLFSSPRLMEAIKNSGPGAAGAGRPAQRLLRSSLVAGEVAISLVLISASVLLVRSFMHVISQDRGFDPERLLTATISLPSQGYADPARQRVFWSDLFARAAAMPGVVAVGGSTALPFSNWEWQSWFEIRGREEVKNDGVSIRTVTPGYFEALRIPLRAGRPLTADDLDGGEPVVVVNEAFVRAQLPGLDPVGQFVRTERDSEGAARPTTSLVNAAAPQPTTKRWMRIVGVAGDTRHVRLEERPRPEMYRPLAQATAPMMVVALRTTGDPRALERTLRSEIRQIDAALPLEQVRTMEEAIDRTTAQRRFQISLIGMFAVLAALLAVVGTYGVMSYVSGLRRREIGIRMALGATATGVKTLLVRQGLRPVIVGIALGVLGSLWTGSLIGDQLFQVDARDPQTIVGAAIAFVVVGAAACWIPARRSSAIDPVRVLRTE
jgi:putative ABC transport system permease protein